METSRWHEYERVVNYWLQEYPGLGERTRGSIVSTLTSAVDPLRRSPIHELFSGDTTLTPEECFDGRIIVVDVPTLQWGTAGRLANRIMASAFQSAVLRRDPMAGRPVFLCADEAQEYVLESDAAFLAAAREFRCACMLVSQNLPGYERRVGKDAAHALLGAVGTHVFHANGCPDTNKWASEMIASTWRSRPTISRGSNENQGAGSERSSSSMGAQVSQGLDPQVTPHAFTMLRAGGPQNHSHSEAIVFQSGRGFMINGKNYVRVHFPQIRL